MFTESTIPFSECTLNVQLCVLKCMVTNLTGVFVLWNFCKITFDPFHLHGCVPPMYEPENEPTITPLLSLVLT